MADTRHVVLDTAFGSGARFLATLARHRSAPATHLHYLALAQSVPGAAVLAALAAAVPALAAQWPLDVPGLHRLHLPTERLTFDLLVGPAEDWLPEIVARVDEFIIAEPLDQIRALQRLATPASTLHIRRPDEQALRSLRAAGFTVTGEPEGEWQHAAYTSRKPQAPRAAAPERRAIVIGAGVAGSAACERLAARGWQVTLIERHDGPAQEASGNRAGIFMPLLSKDDNIPTRLTRAAYLYAQRAWQRLGGLDPNAPGSGTGEGTIRGKQCGVLQLARDAEHALLQKEIVDTWRYPERYVRWLDAQQASAMLGAPTPHGAWHFPGGGWATPATACRAMLHACGDKLHRVFHAEALRIERAGEEWQVFDAQGKLLAAAPTLVLANGAGATALEQAHDLPLYTMRGQVTHLREGSFPSLNMVVCREAYMTPPVDGVVSVGATYDKSTERQLWQSSQDENLLRAEEILGSPHGAGAPLEGRVGFRTMAPDRLPLVGAMPDSRNPGRSERLRDLPRHPGLHALLGYASRGLIWAPLAAEILACQLEDEPLPIEATLASALDPGRFLLKQRRKL
ncbi:tRNA 5-methylaminomethyl-2-thiouridine biosynthesis bifunctional protein [Duganella sp. CF458]|uniref:FAD-dependent 5-carboxymethylaminomethyl-2-thiouridine(34) oxidoreductase MnmC n=1 Tax=Duganella sp. CF458 TaxID=1884368 RepID=UPI0008E2A26D|nr:FAD-dependent 5-carboxymethylaminomethyl-2-thiouridine(34) oxidoreductase MnmC [Duganella sp. CF458]SFG19030.1 tRNA 5-methylaminomethyl-2-thiouridine biosynthesis bifunctional protein [Duganella sp. CF458]